MCSAEGGPEKAGAAPPGCPAHPSGAHLQQARDDVREELQQGLLGDPLDDFGLHLDGGQVDGVVGRLDDGAQHFDALLRVDGAGQRGGGLLGSPHHLKHGPRVGELQPQQTALPHEFTGPGTGSRRSALGGPRPRPGCAFAPTASARWVGRRGQPYTPEEPCPTLQLLRTLET